MILHFTGKSAEISKDRISTIVVTAIKQIAEEKDGELILDTDNLKIEKKTGAGIEDSELIHGILLDKERVHDSMPLSVKDAKILLLDEALEVKNTEIDAKIQITDPAQMQAFLDMEEKMLKNITDKIIKSGANVVLCQKGIDDLVQHYLAKAGIYAVRRVKKSDMEKVSKATGASLLTNIDELTPKDIGIAGLVEERKFGEEEMTYITECPKAKAVTILIRGGTQHVVDEVERAVKDSIGDIAAALKVKKVVAGAGAIELEVSRTLRNYANTLSGREQLAVQSFADALEVIPITLAENAGLDPIDSLTELKAAHDKGMKWAGLDAFTGKVIDAWKSGVIEPLKIKTQAIKSASEVAELILRIDDVLASGKGSNGPQMPHQEMPGME